MTYDEVMKTHKEWLDSFTNDSLRAVARSAGMNEGNFSGKVKKGLTADEVISIAHAYKLDVVKALIDTGHLLPSDDPRSQDATLSNAITMLKRLQEGDVRGIVQDEYDLVADGSEEEGGGEPDDYEP